MPPPLRLVAAACALVTAVATAAAKTPLHARIDALVAARHPGHAAEAAPPADDAEFLRRAALDLRGGIPTAGEVRAFLADPSPDKRPRRIDALLAAPGYARRMAHHFDVVLMERRRDSKVPRAAWEKYLRDAFAANRPYDELVREILSADGTAAATRPAAKFLLDRDLEPNLVTKDVGRIFLGRNFQCAQCHDHPVVAAYKQEHYYGIYAFLNRSYLFPRAADAKAVIAEKAEGDVSFTSVFDETKEQKSTTPRMPGGKPLAEPKLEKGKEYEVPPKGPAVRPVPAFSRRQPGWRRR